MWLGGWAAARTRTQDDTYGGKSHIAMKWGVHFLNVYAHDEALADDSEQSGSREMSWAHRKGSPRKASMRNRNER